MVAREAAAREAAAVAAGVTAVGWAEAEAEAMDRKGTARAVLPLIDIRTPASLEVAVDW